MCSRFLLSDRKRTFTSSEQKKKRTETFKFWNIHGPTLTKKKAEKRLSGGIDFSPNPIFHEIKNFFWKNQFCFSFTFCFFRPKFRYSKKFDCYINLSLKKKGQKLGVKKRFSPKNNFKVVKNRVWGGGLPNMVSPLTKFGI